MKEIKVDPANTVFARTMEILTYIGLALMFAPGIIYIVYGSGFVSTEDAVKYWNVSAADFWKITRGIKISGYSWFLNNLGYLDCLSIIGVVLLALAPLASIVAALTRSDIKYKIILAVVIIEFIIAIVRPLFMYVTGH